MRYIDKLRTIPTDNAAHPLVIGNALHKGIETSVNEAVKEYYMSYPMITDRHVEEVMKLEILIPKAQAMIPEGEHEVMLSDKDFIGFVDLVSRNDDGTYDIYDFKYSNNIKNYKNSSQMHLYKYFWEKQNPGKEVRNLYFLFVPKTSIRQKKTESLFQFRRRLMGDLSTMSPTLVEIEYDPTKVIEFLLDSKRLLEATTFPLYKDYLWKFSEYYNYIEKGEDYMILPKVERRDITKAGKKTIWIYGKPFSGKTTFANAFPDPLMLNTDGNVQFVDAPYISIKDTVVVEGRRTVRTLAWQNFKDTVDELEKKENEFKTIIVDLLEDLYESCRLYMYDKMGISHESDDSFRAWDKVRTEFLSTIRKLMNLDYENIILISHEDTSKDITKKSGENITAIKPNLQEKTANKVAGMVHIVARVIVEEDDSRTLSFKQNEVTFGGGRLTTPGNEIPLDHDEFVRVYQEANLKQTGNKKINKGEEPKEEKTRRRSKVKDEPEEVKEEVNYDDMNVSQLKEELDTQGIEYGSKDRKRDLVDRLNGEYVEEDVEEDVEEEIEEPEEDIEEETQEEKPKTRTRRRRSVKEEEEEEEEVSDEKPKRRRTRKKRS